VGQERPEGDAGISAQHALVLVNHGRATGDELLGVAVDGDVPLLLERRREGTVRCDPVGPSSERLGPPCELAGDSRRCRRAACR
jgi:hypothetical protein